MKINSDVINQVQLAKAQLIVVTKYGDKTETEKLISQLKDESCVLGWGENRTASLEAKNLPRDRTHFIGRLQSRQLPIIVEHCETIHSLASLKHAQKINALAAEKNLKVKVFIQINVGEDPAKEGIAPAELPSFLEKIREFGFQVIGLSTMGWGEFEETEKCQEFKTLMALKDQYLPNGLTSAGTSRDYRLALDEGIDIVRVGKGIIAS